MPGELRRHYEIRVRGALGARLRTAFMALSAHSHPGGDTLLRGELPDRAALFGVLAQIENLGLELLEVRQVSSTRPGRRVLELGRLGSVRNEDRGRRLSQRW